MKILWIWWILHDWNITVSNNNHINLALQTERIDRKKHNWIENIKSLKNILSQLKINIVNDIEEIVFVDKYLFYKWIKKRNIVEWIKNLWKKITVVDHHLAHLASSFYPSKFDKATLVSFDWKWDEASWKVWYWNWNKIEELYSIPMWYSLWRLWNATNTIVGFPWYQYSWKTMALAWLWEPVYLERLLSFVSLQENGTYNFHLWNSKDTKENRDFFFSKSNITNLILELTWLDIRKGNLPLNEEYYNLASSIQALTNIISEHVVKNAIKTTWSNNLCISWGVWLNGIMNKHLLDMEEVDGIFIQPASNDMGLSLWGVQYHLHNNLWLDRDKLIFNPYLWRSVNFLNLELLLYQNKDKLYSYKSSNVENEVAQLLANDNIVAWVQWKEEFWPRALWNRSILASGINPDMKDILNRRIKHRESFRPFAPAVTRERSMDYFEEDIESPYMLLIDNIKQEVVNKISCASHNDWTARVQTVRKEFNTKFHDLIQNFWNISWTPILLNTSLNDNWEPIVWDENDAIRFILKSDVDFLVIWDYIICKK